MRDPDVVLMWLRSLAVDVVEHECCEGCQRNAAQALEEVGLLHLLAEAGLADPRDRPPFGRPAPEPPGP